MVIVPPINRSIPDFLRSTTDAFNHPESRLLRDFPVLIGSLLVEDLTVPYWQKTIEDPTMYSLVPVVPKFKLPSTIGESGWLNTTTREVRRTFPNFRNDGVPFIDARQAIGLTVKNEQQEEWLIAVASAGIPDPSKPDASLKIVQIQNVSGVSHDSPNDQFAKLFRTGIDWKNTLVRAWENIGHTIGVESMSIQALHNNQWKSNRHNMNKGTYNGVAKQRGYTQDPGSGDWFKPVSEIEPTTRSPIGLRQRIGATLLAVR